MFDIQIPKITDEELLEKYRRIKPLVRDSEDGILKWVKGDERIYVLRETSYICAPTYLRPVKPDELDHLESYDFACIHTTNGIFKPSVAEVLAQIDYESADQEILNMETGRKMRLVAFEVEWVCEKDLWGGDILRRDLFLNNQHLVSRVKLYYSDIAFKGLPEEA